MRESVLEENGVGKFIINSRKALCKQLTNNKIADR